MESGFSRTSTSQLATPAVCRAISTSSAAGLGTGRVCSVITAALPP